MKTIFTFFLFLSAIALQAKSVDTLWYYEQSNKMSFPLFSDDMKYAYSSNDSLLLVKDGSTYKKMNFPGKFYFSFFKDNKLMGFLENNRIHFYDLLSEKDSIVDLSFSFNTVYSTVLFNERFMAFQDENYIIKVYDIKTNSLIEEIDKDTILYNKSYAFDDSGNFLIGIDNTKMYKYDLLNKSYFRKFNFTPELKGSLNNLKIVSDSTILFTTTEANIRNLYLYNFNNGQLLYKTALEGYACIENIYGSKNLIFNNDRIFDVNTFSFYNLPNKPLMNSSIFSINGTDSSFYGFDTQKDLLGIKNGNVQNVV